MFIIGLMSILSKIATYAVAHGVNMFRFSAFLFGQLRTALVKYFVYSLQSESQGRIIDITKVHKIFCQSLNTLLIAGLIQP
jgi:hypothetical protein